MQHPSIDARTITELHCGALAWQQCVTTGPATDCHDVNVTHSSRCDRESTSRRRQLAWRRWDCRVRRTEPLPSWWVQESSTSSVIRRRRRADLPSRRCKCLDRRRCARRRACCQSAGWRTTMAGCTSNDQTPSVQPRAACASPVHPLQQQQRFLSVQFCTQNVQL